MFTKLVPQATIPTRATSKSAGYDLHCIEEVVVPPYHLNNYMPTLIKTGISCQLPAGHCGQIWGRSGLGNKGIVIRAGLIDEDYEGEIGVLLINFGPVAIKFQGPSIAMGIGVGQDEWIPGAKVAQLVFVPYYSSDDGASRVRGTGGFGSTDVTIPESWLNAHNQKAAEFMAAARL